MSIRPALVRSPRRSPLAPRHFERSRPTLFLPASLLRAALHPARSCGMNRSACAERPLHHHSRSLCVMKSLFSSLLFSSLLFSSLLFSSLLFSSLFQFLVSISPLAFPDSVVQRPASRKVGTVRKRFATNEPANINLTRAYRRTTFFSTLAPREVPMRFIFPTQTLSSTTFRQPVKRW